MRKYKLVLDLQFETDIEAGDVMKTSAELMERVDISKDRELIKKFKEQVDESVIEINKVVVDALAQRPAVMQFLNEANEIAERMRKMRMECEHTFSNLQNEAERLTGFLSGTRGEAEEKIKKTENVIEVAYKKLSALDEAINEAKKRVEACRFIQDISDVRDNLIKNGSATMYQRRQGDGQYEKVSEWKV